MKKTIGLILFSVTVLNAGNMCIYYSNRLDVQIDRMQKAHSLGMKKSFYTSISLIEHYTNNMLLECNVNSPFYERATKMREILKQYGVSK